MSIPEKITEIESEIARTQKNKATARHIGLLKAKLAKLRRELLTPRGGGGRTGEGFDVSKTGDSRIGLVGFPSVGKSTLLNKLTTSHSEVAAYDFTTLTTVPGIIYYKGAKIQLLDLPGIIEGAKDGKGRGRQVIAVARTCNMLLIVLDAMKPFAIKRKIEYELEGFGIKLNRDPPNIKFETKDRGGVNFVSTFPQEFLDQEIAQSICAEYKIHNAEIIVKYPDATPDDLIDIIEGNRIYIPAIYIFNKIDQITIQELEVLSKIPHSVFISAHFEWNLDELLLRIWEYLDFIRVYTKPRGQIPDFSAPIIMPSKSRSIESLCNRIHRNLIHDFKFAYVWGSSVKHNPQKVGKDHLLDDEDVVQIVKKI
ncbi:developmentally-regulated gtp-binding protein [Anaeramoeba ignava]|uniref:Developmentally-regulated gtp-binding protein n=1 Tax=Anaeramoeba ignava TaxID=1746090 RepID=A0A9Q0RER7_ANAIG|nr:developmentally-regulated gtp-binding protein [Anaeramoeba ignava]|eukprot:Anaeramoba_ignava/a352622_74.p1 GENE.a352622_74~~a352622_74.p1  ORF type:complete len:380 (+),score=27.27 a352622_74:39-1142(+)